MAPLDIRIAQAHRHVEDGRRILLRQRELIAGGSAPSGAEELLYLFERTQKIFEDDLARVIEERDGRQPR